MNSHAPLPAADAFDWLATMVTLVRPDGRCLLANAMIEHALGLSRRTLLRGNVLDWMEDPAPLRDTLRAVAQNDYTVELPVEDATRYPVVVARLFDDRPMPVRDKGPLFIIYPFDSDERLRSERYYSRSAWQLKAIDVA